MNYEHWTVIKIKFNLNSLEIILRTMISKISQINKIAEEGKYFEFSKRFPVPRNLFQQKYLKTYYFEFNIRY